MIFILDAVLKRASSIMLVFFVGAFLGQAVCVLHVPHVESRMGAGMDHPTAQASPSMAVHGQSQHGEHSSAPGQDQSGACAVFACASAMAVDADHGFEPLNSVLGVHVAYLGGMTPTDAEMVPPPPRLG